MSNFREQFKNLSLSEKVDVLQTVAELVNYDCSSKLDYKDIFMKTLLQPQIEVLTEHTIKEFLPDDRGEQDYLYEHLSPELIASAKDYIGNYLIENILTDLSSVNLQDYLNQNTEYELRFALDPIKEDIEAEVNNILDSACLGR